MGRTARFQVKNTAKGWRVNVPASVSETGSRQQRYFKTRAEAAEFSKNLKSGTKEFGERVRTLSPGDMEDAAEAIRILEPLGSNLITAARYYASMHDARAKAPSLDEAWEQAQKSRGSLSSRYQQNLRSWRKRMPERFAQSNIADIEAMQIQSVLDEITDGVTAWKAGLAMIRLVLADQVKQGLLKDNPCLAVMAPRTRKTEEVTIYSVDQLKALFAACKDYSKGKDRSCSECAVPFAFLAFAGIRPTELTRLRWNDVNLELLSIRLGGNVTKTGKTRNVRINPTLLKWIEFVPKAARIGKIIPGRWTEKATRVRNEAKLDGRELQDALRHSFGSYLLAVENDINALKSDMGHQHVDTFFVHYHNALTRSEAAPYWEILPLGTS